MGDKEFGEVSGEIADLLHTAYNDISKLAHYSVADERWSKISRIRDAVHLGWMIAEDYRRENG
jgi:hypothetical protein